MQLQESGDEVGQLILLDSFVIADRPEFHTEPSLAELMKEFGITTTDVDVEPTVQEVRTAVAAAGGILGAMCEQDFDAVHRAFRHATPLAADWRPRTYDGDATFVSATIDPPAGQRAVDDWHTAIAGQVTEVKTSCTHARMLLPENVVDYIHAIDGADAQQAPTEQQEEQR